MDDFSSKWTFKRISIIPILDCVGEANNSMVEPFMFTEAANYIEQAMKFKGIAVQGNSPQITRKITVYFSLQFPSEKEFNEFVKNIQKNNLI